MEISERKRIAENVFKVNFLMNCYALENAAFGETAAGDEVPFDRYVEELALGECEPYRFRDCIAGTTITSDGKIAQKSREEFMKECFMFRMELVFASAPKGRTAEYSGGLTSYKYGFDKYIKELFPLFSEIMYTEAEEAPGDGAPAFADRHARALNYGKICRFLVAVRGKRLKPGGCVDRYIKGIEYLPRYVRGVLKEVNGKYFLACDADSPKLKLACLAAANFMDVRHTRLFEQKTVAWEKKRT